MGLFEEAASGQSGAALELLPDGSIAKWSPDEELARSIIRQGQWLMNHSCEALVPVRGVYSNGYTMQPLCPLPLKVIDPLNLALEIKRRLEGWIWNRPAEVDVNIAEMTAYAKYLASQWFDGSELELTLEAWISYIDWSRFQTCLTHGDPTFSNVMLRGTELVLIDPIPARAQIPPFRAVDIAKICQSLLGYEVVRFGWPLQVERSAAGAFMAAMVGGDDAELEAVRFFTVLHFLRLLPYTPIRLVPIFQETIRELVRV